MRNPLFKLGLFALILMLVAPMAATAQSTKTLVWNALNCDITLQANGDLRVIETNEINFTNGVFNFGYRDIESSRITSVTDIQASEEGRALRLETGTTGSMFRIKFYLNPPAQRETRTVQLAYTVKGATRYYDKGDQVWWACVYKERNGSSVLASKTVIHLPKDTTATAAETYGAAAQLSGKDTSTVTAVARDAIPSGTPLEVRVQIPHGVISGNAPSWQQNFDNARVTQEQAEATRRTNDPFALLLGAVAALFGPAAVFALWQTRGRDPNVGKIADYLTRPPEGVTAGVAGTLIDQKADMRDVIASLVDLARRGVLTMREQKTDTRFGIHTVADWSFGPGPNYGKVALAEHEKHLLYGMKLDSGERDLSSLKAQFFAYVPGIKDRLYQELVKQGFYNSPPPSIRNGYLILGVGLIVLGVFAILLMGNLLSGLTNFFFCLPAAIILTGALLVIASPAMPRATRKGAEAKMKLEAFRRYLVNIEKYLDVKTARDQFDLFLPFAIAFGIEKSWIGKFAQAGASVPPWYYPDYPGQYYDPYGGYARGYPGSYGYGGRGGSTHTTPMPSAPSIEGAAREDGPGGLEGMSQGMTGGLMAMSAGLTQMLNDTANTFASTPQPQVGQGGAGWGSSGGSGWGGGWSGGGDSGGGSSGDGGGGWG